jgi:hypothetical protein
MKISLLLVGLLALGCNRNSLASPDPAASAAPAAAAPRDGVKQIAMPTNDKQPSGAKGDEAKPAEAAASGTPVADGSRKGKSEEPATGDTLTEFQKKRLLGHYSTMDGASGFILDRTKSPWKAKLDGTSAVLTLSGSPATYDTTEYRASNFWIRVDKNGTVLLFDGPKQTEGVRVVRDANANQL